ncbi:hypothetical protein [Streptomyces broussonetiae]|uniref:hypothetical protein n=1 Tax=Streptomyces broussonetiae TaxID=2686304 RepID=UPI0035E32959
MTNNLHQPGTAHATADDALNAPDGRTLHALRVAGWLAAERLEVWRVAGAGPVLARLADAGLVRLVKSPRGEMYGLTPDGTARATALLATWLERAAADETAAAVGALAAFEGHDATLKQLVTDYQRQGAHGVGERLAAFHEAASEAIDAVGAAHPLWESYPGRLRSALAHVHRGETDYVTSPLVESYHTVWHLAHRDMRLLREGLTP